MTERATGSNVTEPRDLAKLIDHTLLKPEARQADIRRYCDEARTHQFRSVCVNAVHAPLVHEALAGSGVLTCVVVGFPLGAMSHRLKAAEAAQAVADGADEIDMVIDIGALKDGRHDAVRADIAGVKQACGQALLKVIIETCLLTDEEKVAACKLAVEAGADFVKTSTGFSTGGATEADVALMRRTVGPAIGVKASGGVRDFEGARAMVAAGASRIGTSNGVALVSGARATGGY